MVEVSILNGLVDLFRSLAKLFFRRLELQQHPLVIKGCKCKVNFGVEK